MARAANTYSTTLLSVDQGAQTQEVRLRRYISSTEDDLARHYAEYDTSSPPTTKYDFREEDSGGPALGTIWRNFTTDFACDTTYYWQCFCNFYFGSFSNLKATKQGTVKSFLTYAVDPTVGTPSLSGETASAVTVDGTWTPATNETTANIRVQYKKTSDSTWTENPTDSDTGTGYSSISIDQTVISSLEAETSYDFRLACFRSGTSNPTTTFYSSVASTTTLADTPSITTVAASSIGHQSAVLSGTLDHNGVDGDISWRYDTVDPGTPDDSSGTEVAHGANPATVDGTRNLAIGSLSASTTYYFWAIYDPTGAESTVFGSILNFTTNSNPAAEAADEDLMITQYVDGQYGVATTVYFTLRQPAATSSDSYYTSTAPVNTTDIEIVKDGTHDGAADNAAAQVDAVEAPQLYSLQLSAAEMQADVIDVIISDAAGSAFRDHHIQVRTQQNLGTIVVNAAQKGTNTDAVTYTGNGTGAGLKCAAGDNDGVDIDAFLGKHVLNYGTLAAYNSSTSVDLDNSTAVATNDHYNGAVLLTTGGTGPGQARFITDYDGATYAATLHKALAVALSTDTTYIIVPAEDVWQFSPGAELSAVPTKTSTMLQIVQGIFQRFFYKRTQTATAFSMKKLNDTELAQGTVNDDGTTQTHDEIGTQ